MDLEKCVRCGKLFTKIKMVVCPACEREEDKLIFEVQKFLRDNPNSSLDEVSDALDIYVDDIERWIAEKRLTVNIHSKAALRCSMCGAVLTSGKVCNECLAKLGEVKQEAPKEKPIVSSESRFRDRGGDSSITKFRRE